MRRLSASTSEGVRLPCPASHRSEGPRQLCCFRHGFGMRIASNGANATMTSLGRNPAGPIVEHRRAHKRRRNRGATNLANVFLLKQQGVRFCQHPVGSTTLPDDRVLCAGHYVRRVAIFEKHTSGTNPRNSVSQNPSPLKM